MAGRRTMSAFWTFAIAIAAGGEEREATKAPGETGRRGGGR